MLELWVDQDSDEPDASGYFQRRFERVHVINSLELPASWVLN
jgi:hypothetical protein